VCYLETTKILVNEEEAKAQWGVIAPRERKKNAHKVFYDKTYKN
jgi:hypothetical protein